MLVEDSLRAVKVVSEFDGSIVDVGSGGGAPGIPIAIALPEREVTLLEANGRKCDFLRRWAPPNGVAVAKALALPVVAAEWCLPLVAPGGAAVLFVGPSADAAAVARAAEKLAGRLVESPPGLLVLRKERPTPPGFPRRSGMARKRPLA